MPELPEVETIRRDLAPLAVGRRISSVQVRGTRSIRRHASERELIDRVTGRTVTSVGRKGKYLLLRLDSADTLVVHLGMSGQVLHARSRLEPRPRHTHVVLALAGGGELRFVDPRTFGEVFVAAPDARDGGVPELAHLGFDALEQVTSWRDLAAVLGGRRTKLKPLLMDQRVIAGLGNIYSDEILFAAGVRHDRRSDSLSPQEVRRLHRAMTRILHDAIEHRGSSLADQQYRDLNGDAGSFRARHRVYAREGAPCLRCRTPIVRENAAGRSTFFCPRCQT